MHYLKGNILESSRRKNPFVEPIKTQCCYITDTSRHVQANIPEGTRGQLHAIK